MPEEKGYFKNHLHFRKQKVNFAVGYEATD